MLQLGPASSVGKRLGCGSTLRAHLYMFPPASRLGKARGASHCVKEGLQCGGRAQDWRGRQSRVRRVARATLHALCDTGQHGRGKSTCCNQLLNGVRLTSAVMLGVLIRSRDITGDGWAGVRLLFGGQCVVPFPPPILLILAAAPLGLLIPHSHLAIHLNAHCPPSVHLCAGSPYFSLAGHSGVVRTVCMQIRGMNEEHSPSTPSTSPVNTL
mgnify:CR=1 FL=1